jgi:transketolase
MDQLKKRILEISYKNKISHIGSSVSAVRMIDAIYKRKEKDDIFILSSGHAGLALYVVLEKHYGYNAEKLFLEHGIHPHRDEKHKIYCSTGSLGTGITIACGAALVNKNRKVYCLCSDGETAEGSFWEALNFVNDEKLDNFHVFINANGYGAYKSINKSQLKEKLGFFSHYNNILVIDTQEEMNCVPFLNGLNAHYYIMNEKDFNITNSMSNEIEELIKISVVESKLVSEILAQEESGGDGIMSMTSRNAQKIINVICNFYGGNYLEIGTYQGASFCAAICNTKLKKAICIDFYTEVGDLGLASKQKLIENINNTPHTCKTCIIDDNVKNVDFLKMPKINILFYDGPHDYENSIMILNKIYSCLDDNFILMADDMNYQPQSQSINEFLKRNDIQVLEKHCVGLGSKYIFAKCEKK